MSSASILAKYVKGNDGKVIWNYHSVIGMLNFLTNSVHPEITYAVHQCAWFCENPKLINENVVHNVLRYLLSIQSERSHMNQTLDGFNIMLFNPDSSKGIWVYADALFDDE